MAEQFIDMLRGNSNTLGRTEEVVALVIKEPKRINELFDLFFQDDEWVRLRVNSSLKRLWRHDKQSIAPFIDRWITDVASIDQPSINWTFAQMVEECPELLSDKQRAKSTEIIKKYLTSSSDWIVLNTSIQALGTLAKNDPDLASWLKPQLKKLSTNDKKSVARRAAKTLETLQ